MPVAPTPMTAPLPMPVASPLLAQLGRLGELFDLLGAVAIVAGALLTAQRALRTLRRQGGEAAYSVARETFGRGLLLGLEILIAAHLLPAAPPPASLGVAWPPALALLGWATLALGLLLAAQAFFNLGASLTPLPEPMAGAALVTSGAYARCRHPLYQAILICSWGVTLALGSLLHLGLLLALAMVLARKARREERRLLQLHPGYAAYRSACAAILPGVPGLDWR